MMYINFIRKGIKTVGYTRVIEGRWKDVGKSDIAKVGEGTVEVRAFNSDW
jgi:hypothetical protein